eukprot:TRINITY_DN7826_c0_g1_i2.p1 TRINITY_DN7826_c0_g1~~TRINITY_DN7826_c0_g1_i2.p1  ORF type:complete len:1295 (+),score=332.56 TRINITY_DN7826_c0_g1_i2:87-3971(+)
MSFRNLKDMVSAAAIKGINEAKGMVVSEITNAANDLNVEIRPRIKTIKEKPHRRDPDSFYILDKRHLRTIFDDVTKWNAEAKTEDPSSAPSSPVQSFPSPVIRKHRRAKSDTNSPVQEHSESSKDEAVEVIEKPSERQTLFLSQTKPDKPPSATTLARVEQAKQYLEEYYWELLTWVDGRVKRESKLEESLQEATDDFQKELLVREHRKKENVMLRSRRLCGRLSDFHLLKKIGKGAYGEVYLCRQKATSHLLALKRISKSNLSAKNQIAHVTAESDVLKGAENIWLVHLHYTFQDSEYIYFAMDYIPGGDLRHYLWNVECLDLPDARLYIAQMFLAVDALHSLGYIHRDLKPDNFLVDSDGNLKLADFGLSKKGVSENYREPFKGQMPVVRLFTASTLARRQTWQKNVKKTYSLVGSPDYMAIEIMRGKGYSLTADWWSLGCVLFEMLVGFPPFTGDTPHEVFSNIMNYSATLANPQLEDSSFIIPDVAWDLITHLICEPEVRLGKDTIDEVKSHPFFQEFDWDQVRNMKPAFIPNLTDETDTSYFEGAEDITGLRHSDKGIPFLEKISKIGMNSFDDLNFSKAIHDRPERERSFSSSSDESPIGTGPPLRRVGSLSPRDLINNSPIRRLKDLKRMGSFGSNSSLNRRKIYSRAAPQDVKSHPEPVSLNSLSIRDWKVLCTGAVRVRLAKDSVIVKEGGHNTHLYRLKSGVVRIEKNTLQGNQEKVVVLGRLTKNRVFGEMSFIEDHWTDLEEPDSEGNPMKIGNVSASVLVDSEEVELYQIDRSFIFSLFLADKDLFARFYQIMVGILAERAINLPFRNEVNRLKGNMDYLSSSDPSTKTPEGLKRSAHLLRESDSDLGLDSPDSKLDEKFIQKFDLPSDECLIKSYKCILIRRAHEKEKKLIGHMQIGRAHVCFYSRVFGFNYKKAIKFNEISRLSMCTNDPEDTHIRIVVGRKKYTFNNFDIPITEPYKVLEGIYDSPLFRAVRTRDRSASNPERYNTNETSPFIGPTVTASHSGQSASTPASPVISPPGNEAPQPLFSLASMEDLNEDKEAPPASPRQSHSDRLSRKNLSLRGFKSRKERKKEEKKARHKKYHRDSTDEEDISDQEDSASRDVIRVSSMEGEDDNDSGDYASESRDEWTELSLNQQDWAQILKGSEFVTFARDEIILEEGSESARIYQIGSGICRIEKRGKSGKTEVLGMLGQSEMFGEISFVMNTRVTAGIVADSEVDIYAVSKEYLESLFETDPLMEGKFYKFLALVLSRRIRQREMEEELRLNSVDDSKKVFLSND